MGNCLVCRNNTLIHAQSAINLNLHPPLPPNEIDSSGLFRPEKGLSQTNPPLLLSEDTSDANMQHKKITTPVPSATTLSQKVKGSKKRNSSFSAFSNSANIVINVFGPIKSGKTSLIQTFWNGLLHPFNPNDPYIHSEKEEVVQKKINSNSKQYEILFKVPNTKEVELKKSDISIDYYLVLFALNEVEQFEEAKDIYSNLLKEVHTKKKDHSNSLSISNVIMLGTKSDLEKKVKEEDINNYVKDNGLMYYEFTVKNYKLLNSFLHSLINVSEQNIFMFSNK
jgi:hypothetical protein